MKRAELLGIIAGVLPIGALAVVRVPDEAPPRTEPEPQAATAPRDRWMIVHPGVEGKQLPRHHEVGDGAACSICRRTGIPGQLWQPL
jgi:hypothetical protein